MAVIYGATSWGDTSLDGSTALKAATSALSIKINNPAAVDGVYWINLPTVGATQVYCIMNSAFAGGGWMMAMKATTGTTFNYDANYWTTINTLNPTDNSRSNADAKYNTMNYFLANDLLAIFPDVTTSNGGSIPGTGSHTWVERKFNNGTKISLVSFFATTTGPLYSSGVGGSGIFKQDAMSFSGWESGVFSSQKDIRFYGFNFNSYVPNPYNINSRTRWGYGWNENGEGLFPGVDNGALGSCDIAGGIGLSYVAGATTITHSAGDHIGCCNNTYGVNRAMRVEVYVR